jgi:hypothetical protein
MTNSRTYIRSFQKLLFENYFFSALKKVFNLNAQITENNNLNPQTIKEEIVKLDNLEFLKERKVKINFFE